MKYKYGNSICVSSQAGCRMGCTFCASGKLGLVRDLTAGEIMDQILQAEKITGEKINHVVVMGTGEPFDNYENLSEFIRRINSKNGLNIGNRNITVSTSGIIPMIDRFAEDFPQVNLAVSLHAPNDEKRSQTMPVNRKYPVTELIPACRRYTEKTGRRITFEYAVVDKFNDSDEDVIELAGLLKGMLCHVNLIPLNEIESEDTVRLRAGSRKRAKEIAELLESRGIPATVRRSLGRDIDAACGQLRLNAEK
jgi:23S rRNA (adenine2503-C2)-methyltransferase